MSDYYQSSREDARHTKTWRQSAPLTDEKSVNQTCHSTADNQGH